MLNAPSRRPGSASITPRIVKLLRADRQPVADLHVELREQLRAHQHAEVLQQRVLIRHAVGQLHPAVVRKAGLDRAQLHHPRAAIGHDRPRRAIVASSTERVLAAPAASRRFGDLLE